MRRARLKRLSLVLAVAAVAVVLAIAVVLVMNNLHAAAKAADVVAIDETRTDKEYPAGLWVKAKLLEVDLDRELATLQLELVPIGPDVRDAETGDLRGPIKVTVSDGSNPGIGQTTVIPRRGQGQSVAAEVDLDGNVEDYPRDVHTGHLTVFAFQEVGGQATSLPVVLQVYGAWPGLDVEFAAPPAAASDQLSVRELQLTVKRSHATTTVVYFSVALIWVLILTVVGMTMSVVLGQRESQIAMLAFFGTLLFALTEFRNALPGAPPAGAFSDYLAFFWAYAVVIVAVGVIGGLWLYRRGRGRPRLEPVEDDEVPLDPADFS